MKTYYLFILLSILRLHTNAQNDLLIPIQIDDKWGFVNEKLDVVIAADYDSVSLFIRNVARMKKGDLYGVIDKKGNTILEAKYQKVIIGHVASYLLAHKGKRKIYFDNEGNKMKKSPGNMLDCGTGICYVHPSNSEKYIIERENKYALKFLSPYPAEQRGSIQYRQDTTDFVFDSVIPFYRNSFIVEKNNEVGIWIPVDLYVKIEFKYDEILVNTNTYCSSLHRFRVDNKWGLMDHLGREITAPIYHSIHEKQKEIQHEFYLVEYEKGFFGYIDTSGKEYFTRISN